MQLGGSVANLFLTKKIGKSTFYFFYAINSDNTFTIFGQKNKNLKPILYFKNQYLDSAEKRIEAFLEPYLMKCKQNEEWKEKKKMGSIQFKEKITIGTILSASWGYEQTNVDFYKVININKNKTKITIIEIGQIKDHSKPSDDMSHHVLPDSNNIIGEAIEKMIKSDRIKINESISLGLWDGTPKYTSSYY
jgi:hypothetical protein